MTKILQFNIMVSLLLCAYNVQCGVCHASFHDSEATFCERKVTFGNHETTLYFDQAYNDDNEAIVNGLKTVFVNNDVSENKEKTTNMSKRPTIGLVLSGGGAKGLAHIGVLKALERHHIPIDYIAGTSMGAIIGGLYASGYTVEEIENIFYSDAMTEWLSGEVSSKYQYYYKENYNSVSMVNVGFDMNKNFRPQIPMSLINPVQMDFAFMEFFATANEVCEGDYTKLMLPFFCMASNVTKKHQSLQVRGNLFKSIRASMTFPFYFSPIKIDGDLMCDGGVYNNFPAEEMQQLFTPDVIIGVQVANNFDDPNEEDLLLYIENMVASDTKYTIPNPYSVLLKPDMKFVGIMDFSVKEECIRRGYLTAEANMKQIKHIIDAVNQHSNVTQASDSVREDKYDVNKLREEFNKKKNNPVIDNIIIHSLSEPVQSYVKKLLLIGINHDSVSLSDIKANYLSLASMPNVKSIQPNVYVDGFSNGYILDLDIKTKDLLFAKVGGMLSTDPISNLYLGLEHTWYRHYAYNARINGYIGRYYTSIGADFSVDFPYRKVPMLLEATVNLNNWNFFRNRNGFFEYSPNNYLVVEENNAQLMLSISTFRRGKLTLKAGYGQVTDKYFNKDVILSSDTNDKTEFHHFVVGICNKTSTLDDNIMPTDGIYTSVDIQFVTGHEYFTPGNEFLNNTVYQQNPHTWFQFSLETKFYKHFAEHLASGLLIKTFYSFQQLFFTRKSSLLNAGTFAPTLETYTSFYPEYRANQFLSVGTEQIIIMGKMPLGDLSLRGGYYVFAPVKEILANSDNQPYYGEFFDKIYNIVSLSLISKTRFGNLSLSLSYTQREKSSLSPWNLSLSFGTIMFNRKNIDR